MLIREGHSTLESIHVSMSPSAFWAESIWLSIACQWRSYIQYQFLRQGSISLLGACRSRISTRLHATNAITSPPQYDVQWPWRGFGSHVKSRAAPSFQAQECKPLPPSQTVRLSVHVAPAYTTARSHTRVRGRLHAHTRRIHGRRHRRLETQTANVSSVSRCGICTVANTEEPTDYLPSESKPPLAASVLSAAIISTTDAFT